MLYQGSGAEQLKPLNQSISLLRKKGRDFYLMDALASYISSMNFLKQGSLQDRHQALNLASKAFEKNPRCTIANTALGLALLLNERSEQAYPYLFYASENSSTPLGYYLLSIVDQQSDNARGAQYHYQQFYQLQKSAGGELFQLEQHLQAAPYTPKEGH